MPINQVEQIGKCKGIKIKYNSTLEARKESRLINKRSKNKNKNKRIKHFYFCTDCKSYHLTSH